ncbi:uncharacterized protein [Aegilops tauschii subsp. strangulata]|uniref:uncharacterized protein n=1 Tax=Aegilops tauschii subsp. strangulata TaxID=200361 RepID=UPI000989DE48|nr:uncharacterized protein LOC109732479 [Aegilops tauschii subsp. strangulata]
MPPKKFVMPRAATDPAAAAPPKQRKPRAPLSKPPGITNAEWKADVEHREAVTVDRRNRAKKAREKAAHAAAVAAAEHAAAEQAEAARAAMMNPPGHPYAAWSQQSVGSPAGFSSSPHPWSTPSPGYADGDTHGGFNPNITFPHGRPVQRTPSPAFTDVQYPPYTYSPPDYAASSTPPLRRGLYSQASSSSHLGDANTTEADMEDIIADLADVDDELDYGEEEPEEEEEEEEEPAPTRKSKKKKKKAAKSGEPRIKWASKEEECLAEAWKVVCLDPVTGTNQSIKTYWDCIKAEFDERKLVDPYFKGMHMKRGLKAMANHWLLIQTACNKWYGIVEEVAARPESGTSFEDQLLRMFAMFRDDNSDTDFKYLHVFKRIDKCEKWAAVRRTLAKAKETYKPDAPTAGAADGCPDDNKGAKKAKYGETAAARVQEAVEHCIADAETRAAEREEKTEARWAVLMTNSAIKLDLLRANTAAKLKAQDAKKRNNDFTFLMGGADMLQSGDEKLKAWFLAERGPILNQIPATPTPPPNPAADDDETRADDVSASATPSPTDDASGAPSSTEDAPNSPEAASIPPSPRTPTTTPPEVELDA